MTTIQKLIVEIIDARNLSPKDGHGRSSPYVVVHYYGQRKRTRTAIRDLNPTWNEVLAFNVSAPSEVFDDILELDVYHDKEHGPNGTRKNIFLGRLRLSSRQFVKKGEEALIYFPLEKKHLFSWIQGEIGLKIYYIDEVDPPPALPAEPLPAVVDEAPPPPAASPAPEDAKRQEEKPPETDPPPPVNAIPAAPENDAPEAPESVKESEPLAAENAATEPENDPENEAQPEVLPPPPPEPPQVEAPSPSLPPQSHAGLDHAASISHHWVPGSPMAASISRSTSEFQVSGSNGPRPISRTSTVGSFSSEFCDSVSIERSTFDLVEKMHYLFVRVVKARSLPTNSNPVVRISVFSCHVTSKPARKSSFFEWDQTFAFARDAPDSSSTLEVSTWVPPTSADLSSDVFLGGICFDVSEIPLRDPPDSPLAPQWFRLEGGGAHMGDLMLATWVGTQADESFPDAWKTDTSGTTSSKSKIYLSPKLWYLRATVIEAQDVMPLTALKESLFQVKAQLGFQVIKTKPSVTRNGSPSWNEDLLFVAAEPFSDILTFFLECRQSKGLVVCGMAKIPLTAIERRVDDRNVASRWFGLEDPHDEKRAYKGRVHLRLCFDGGYHVMDEAAHVCSDYRPTARQLWKPAVGTIELGIIRCKNLLPMKTVDGKGSTDAYAVAKYGQKWVRTRTVSDCLDPKWNEQYTWKVYDPCTVLTIGIFDSWGVFEMDNEKDFSRQDQRIGKIRIRISTLGTGKVYRNTYPLVVMCNTGIKKMGEIELAVRFVRATPTLDFLHVYSQPLLPLMHHIRPLGVVQQDVSRNTAAKIVVAHLSRSEPPLRREVVMYMLDTDSHMFSMRKVRANWFRIINVIAGLIDVVRWVENTRTWRNPTATILVHALLVMLVWFPDLIIPTFAFYVFVVGVWNYRFRSRDPLQRVDPKILLPDSVDREELDEEFDTLPSGKPNELIRMRYDKLRSLGSRVQLVLGDLATQGERVQALVTWRDPRATGIFVGLCLMVAVILYLVPSKMVAMAAGFYYLRHPMFRDRMPSPALNFFRRLPSLSDRIM